MIYNKNFKKHLEHLQVVLKLFRLNNLVAKESKCVFSNDKIEYLGHVISKARVATNAKKIQAIRDWLLSQNIKQLCEFLGLTSYYRKFVRSYRTICRPLTKLLKKDTFS